MPGCAARASLASLLALALASACGDTSSLDDAAGDGGAAPYDDVGRAGSSNTDAAGDAAAGGAGSGGASGDDVDGGDAPGAGAGGAADVSGPAVATWTQLQPLCMASCAAAEPPPPDGNECFNGTVSNCVSTCRRATEDVDLACGRCIADAVRWETANGGCSSWECVCLEGLAGFPAVGQPPCEAECEGTLARRAEERLSAPRPPSVGHMPQEVVELEQLASVDRLERAPDGGVWLGASARMREAQAYVGLVQDDLTLAWTAPVQDDDPLLGVAALLGTPEGDVLASVATGAAARLVRFDAEGRLVFDVVVPATDTTRSSLHALQWTAAGYVHAAYDPGTLALLDPFDGSQLWSGILPGTSRTGSVAHVTRLDSRGNRVWSGLTYDGVIGEGVVAKVRDDGTDDAPSLAEQWAARFVGPRGQGGTWDVAVDARDHVVVAGWLYDRRRQGISTVSYGAPFVARLDPDGNELWRWQHAGIVPGRIDAVITDAEGSVYTVGHEDTTAYADPPPAADEVVCSIYGCDALVVRKLSVEGNVVWEYQHRQDASSGHAVALDSQGRLVVGGQRERETLVALLLRFEP